MTHQRRVCVDAFMSILLICSRIDIKAMHVYLGHHTHHVYTMPSRILSSCCVIACCVVGKENHVRDLYSLKLTRPVASRYFKAMLSSLYYCALFMLNFKDMSICHLVKILFEKYDIEIVAMSVTVTVTVAVKTRMSLSSKILGKTNKKTIQVVKG
jgi:hypothetical protein